MACQVPQSYLKIQDGVHDFCNYLLENVPEFQELQKAKQALSQNSEAINLWNEIQACRSTIELFSAQGLPVSQEQQDGLMIKLKEMNTNNITMRYLKALNASESITSKIISQLGQELGYKLVEPGGCC